MMYPEEFPKERNNEEAEKLVFNRLKKISGRYDIFYSRKFVDLKGRGKPEYEVDFIIAEPNRAIICLEVKGGVIHYNGTIWSQNGTVMSKSPDSQSSSACHGLVHKFNQLSQDIPFGWGLCFPDCQLEDGTLMPTSLGESQVIDQLGVLHIESSIRHLFDVLKVRYPDKKGAKVWKYEQFKTELLRGMGFVNILSTRMKYDEERFVELTSFQVDLFQRVTKNKDIITTGPAGSGKTIIAKTLAKDFKEQGLAVLFLCYNRTLANKIRYDIGDREKESNLKVSTFHSIARELIDLENAKWWKEQSINGNEFWEIEVPVKLDEILKKSIHSLYDIIIIDEGQDFKEFWYDVIFSMLKPNGRRFIFLDKMQNIFRFYSSVPDQENFLQYELPENCRNTKKIVSYLSQVVKDDIKAFERSPKGLDVSIINCKSSIDQQTQILDTIKDLVKVQQVEPNQILILLNSEKIDSCLSETKKIGKYPLLALDRQGRFGKGSIHFSNINIFKGLEIDVVIIIDADKIPKVEMPEKLYTEASRAKHKLFIFSNLVA